MVQVSLVICTNTNLVHPTWLTYTIPGMCVQCKYEALLFPRVSLYEALQLCILELVSLQMADDLIVVELQVPQFRM